MPKFELVMIHNIAFYFKSGFFVFLLFISCSLLGQKYGPSQALYKDQEVEVEIQYRTSTNACDSFGKAIRYRFNIIKKSSNAVYNLDIEFEYKSCQQNVSTLHSFIDVGNTSNLGLMESVDFTIISPDLTPVVKSVKPMNSNISVNQPAPSNNPNNKPNKNPQPNSTPNTGNSGSYSGNLCSLDKTGILNILPTYATSKDTLQMNIRNLNNEIWGNKAANYSMFMLSLVLYKDPVVNANSIRFLTLKMDYYTEKNKYLKKFRTEYKKMNKSKLNTALLNQEQKIINQAKLDEIIMFVSNKHKCGKIQDVPVGSPNASGIDINKDVKAILGIVY